MEQRLALENDSPRFNTFKLIYFIFFGSYGVLLPVLPVFFDVNGKFTKYQIGILSMIPNFAAILISPLVSI